MTGIYIHIPFCKSKCYYCDFYSSANLAKKNRFIEALQIEIELKKGGTSKQEIVSVYFGGGTPSLLKSQELNLILSEIKKHYHLLPDAEITLEANPDDLNTDYLKDILSLGINRLSIGIQSFNDNMLHFLHRRHHSVQAVNAVFLAKNAGFDNISIDLMYGIPGMTSDQWIDSLDNAFKLGIQHISAYHFTLSPGTVFGRLAEKGEISELSEEESLEQYEKLCSAMFINGFEHYEISNFSKTGLRSIHNMLYWTGKPYFGFGPAAHSYNGTVRSWNPSQLDAYCNSFFQRNDPQEKEILSQHDLFNEMIITRLRTSDGIIFEKIAQDFTLKKIKNLTANAQKYISSGHIIVSDKNIRLTEKGMFIANSIMSDLITDPENDL